jgi:transposase
MENAEDLSLPQMAALLGTSQEVQFAAKGRREVYEWVEQVLVRQEYALQGKKTKGVVRAYLAKMTGKSLPQITRLVRQYRETGQVRGQDYRRRRFVRLCTEADVRLLAKVDRAHQRLSGPATRRILEREVGVYGHQEYVRLAQISVGHLYNLRKRPDYRKQVALYEVTRPTQVSIAERRRPDPQGRPGYLRVDTVHQGDWDGHKGVYHINSVDAVTQWEAAGCIPIISAESLKPLLEALMAQHPVPILGFHVDNGSECITTWWRNCLATHWWSSPNRGFTSRATTRWWKARMGPSSASTLDTGISPRSTLPAFRSSTSAI